MYHPSKLCWTVTIIGKKKSKIAFTAFYIIIVDYIIIDLLHFSSDAFFFCVKTWLLHYSQCSETTKLQICVFCY